MDYSKNWDDIFHPRRTSKQTWIGKRELPCNYQKATRSSESDQVRENWKIDKLNMNEVEV